MRFHLALFAYLQPPIHKRQHLLFHSTTTHLAHPSIPKLLQLFYSLSPSRPAAPGPLATSHKLETAATSAHSRNTPESSQSLRNPIPDTCATAPPLVAFPAICRWRA